MRLVSVVVPLWLTAIASVSDMSSWRPKPELSVAVIASTAMSPFVNSPSVIAMARPATAAVP